MFTLLQCIYAESDRISITAVKLVGNIILAAKLNGTLCSYKLDFVVSYDNNELMNGMTKQRRGWYYFIYFIYHGNPVISETMWSIFAGHLRTYSVDSMYWQNLKCMELQCSKIETHKVHSKTITVLEVEGGRIITGSEDRTLKVSKVCFFSCVDVWSELKHLKILLLSLNELIRTTYQNQH